eukprot:179379-Prorocentrum_lima.AAC.1
MTSSLVGSEMCIRDRQTIGSWPCRPPPSARCCCSGCHVSSGRTSPLPLCCLLYTSDAADDM